MKIKRRIFLQLGTVATMSMAFFGLGCGKKEVAKVEDKASSFKLTRTKQTTSICPFCAVGCGLVVNTNLETMRAINVEGDPDHPINKGSLCAKGAASIQLTENPDRPSECMWRAPYSDKFEVKPWQWCKERIARLIKDSRDKSFEEKNAKGQVVNRTEGIASMGSAALDNEECWAMQTFMRSLGLVYIEHQARI